MWIKAHAFFSDGRKKKKPGSVFFTCAGDSGREITWREDVFRGDAAVIYGGA